MGEIWGFISREPIQTKKSRAIIRSLMRLSSLKSAGTSGVAIYSNGEIKTFAKPLPSEQLINNDEFDSFLTQVLNKTPFIIIGCSHSYNNQTLIKEDCRQPFKANGITSVVNGNIVNASTIPAELRPAGQSGFEAELFVTLFDHYREEMTREEAFNQVYHVIYGICNTLSILSDSQSLVATTNNGSSYFCFSENESFAVFTTRKSTMCVLLKQNTFLSNNFKEANVKQLPVNTCLSIKLHDMQEFWTDLPKSTSGDNPNRQPCREAPQVDLGFYRHLEIDETPIRKLRRCTRCILPETMPFIEFDEDGVCNYCHTYKKQAYKSKEELHEWADSIRKDNKTADSIVCFSGGRDSSYGLHFFVKEMGLSPVAYSYDWGMATDLALRNQSRMCSKLGIELVIIGADIQKKRENIRKNVVAWLNKPNLGTVPLFMSGDKHYFYYANKVRKDFKLDTILMASNPFEKTYFKAGFCGVKPAILRTGDNMEVEQMRLTDIMHMAGHYLGQFVTNPKYLNRSVGDTLVAAASYYVIPHNYFRLYNYIPWNEDVVNETLIGEYDWEISSDTESTWRIGDGTAPFYNYIYYLIAGFSENDTLRSNQIREGMLTRDQALELTYRDNSPRFESLKWYFDTIGLDMETVLKRVQEIPGLYQKT